MPHQFPERRDPMTTAETPEQRAERPLTRIEYGVRLTYRDGTSTTFRLGGRAAAEEMVDCHRSLIEASTPNYKVTAADLMQRTTRVQFSDWEES